MQKHRRIRCQLACWLAVCFLAQVAWLGMGLPSGHSAAVQQVPHPQLRTPHGSSWSGLRNLATAPVANRLGASHLHTVESCFDFSPHWNVWSLAHVQTSNLGLLPDDTARFGRAPPYSVL